jgi:tripeptidyl-peptidase I
MAKLLTLCFSITLVAASALAVAPSTFRVKESVRAPRGWKNIGAAPADHIISLRVGLPQANFALLEQNLYEISDRE